MWSYVLQKGATWHKLKDADSGEIEIRLKKCSPGEQVGIPFLVCTRTDVNYNPLKKLCTLCTLTTSKLKILYLVIFFRYFRYENVTNLHSQSKNEI